MPAQKKKKHDSEKRRKARRKEERRSLESQGGAEVEMQSKPVPPRPQVKDFLPSFEDVEVVETKPTQAVSAKPKAKAKAPGPGMRILTESKPFLEEPVVVKATRKPAAVSKVVPTRKKAAATVTRLQPASDSDKGPQIGKATGE